MTDSPDAGLAGPGGPPGAVDVLLLGGGRADLWREVLVLERVCAFRTQMPEPLKGQTNASNPTCSTKVTSG